MTRDDVLEAARELFWRQGFQATSMRDIAARLECSKSALYNYFDSKDAMLVAIIERPFQALKEALATAVSNDRPPLERFLVAYGVHLDFHVRTPMDAGMLIMGRRFVAGEGRRGELRRIADEYWEIFRKLLDECMAAGAIRRMDAPILVNMLLALPGSLILSEKQQLSPEELTKMVMDFAMIGMRGVE